jgi:hypothetical protein
MLTGLHLPFRYAGVASMRLLRPIGQRIYP